MKRIEFNEEQYESDYYDFCESRQYQVHKAKDAYEHAYKSAIAFANEVIEASEVGEAPPKWQPKPGDKCAFWHEGDEVDPFPCRDFAEYGVFDHDMEKHTTGLGGFYYDHCALLESLDEIGKPPGYFISRGRCTVSSSE